MGDSSLLVEFPCQSAQFGEELLLSGSCCPSRARPSSPTPLSGGLLKKGALAGRCDIMAASQQ